MFNAELSLIDQVSAQFPLTSQFEAIVAIDEVGRGCVAGPVLTCASLWVKKSSILPQAWVSQVKDSKKLTPQKRLSCFNNLLAEFNYTLSTVPYKNSISLPKIQLFKPYFFTSFIPPMPLQKSEKHMIDNKPGLCCVGFCLGEGNIQEVEEFNIWNAVQIAATRALSGLNEYFLSKMNIPLSQTILLMDGNKPISVSESFRNMIQVTAIKGDDLFISVGLSSILAKVYRDLFMEAQDALFPHFGFAQHKGYGTVLHLQKIQEHGICSLHRLSFLKNYL